jgi:hypothetical protein
MRFSLPDGQMVAIDQPFSFGGYQYPSNWLRAMSPADRVEFGAIEVPDEPMFDHRYYSAPGMPRELAAVKAQRLADLAARRWQAETAGVVVDGVQFATDERTRTALIGARIMATEQPALQLEWKSAAGGFVDLMSAQVIAAADAVAEHVRACFSCERGHQVLIDGLTTAQAVIDHDIERGWP